MKILICLACYFVAFIVIAVIKTVARVNPGLETGLIPDVAIITITTFIAISLSKHYDRKRAKKPNEPETELSFEHIKGKVSGVVLEKCEAQRGNDAELKSILDFCVDNAFIPGKYYTVLFNEYRKK